MSDLISRSELLEIIKGSQELLDFQKDECIACINSCDISYDIDKVVSEIRRASGNGYRDIDGDYVPPMIETKEVIEIVKQGGVADDYCEWRVVDRPHNLPIYNTSCGKIRLQYATGIDIYCNVCGKKIKVVDK